jgi:hypothetical protein
MLFYALYLPPLTSRGHGIFRPGEAPKWLGQDDFVTHQSRECA